MKEKEQVKGQGGKVEYCIYNVEVNVVTWYLVDGKKKNGRILFERMKIHIRFMKGVKHYSIVFKRKFWLLVSCKIKVFINMFRYLPTFQLFFPFFFKLSMLSFLLTTESIHSSCTYYLNRIQWRKIKFLLFLIFFLQNWNVLFWGNNYWVYLICKIRLPIQWCPQKIATGGAESSIYYQNTKHPYILS